ncbi:MAG: AAA family ATPase, partial [bacterium]
IEHLKVAASTIEAIDHRYTDNKLLSYKIKETGFGRAWLPDEVSDGTIQCLSLFIPLEDERIRFAAYDEPENSVHPDIQKHFVRTCIKKSAEKQIVLATHSIAAVNEVPPEALYTIRRNPKGESEIHRVIDVYPETKAVVEKGIMPLGEYWESGAIGGMPEQLDLELDEDKE